MQLSWAGNPKRIFNENFEVTLSSQCDSVVPFQQACDEVAITIANKFDNLFLTMSGGCDSEHVANVLLRNKIPFTPLLLTYEKVTHNDQRYERWFAKHWCRKNNIKPLEIDISDYLNSQADHNRFIEVKPRLFYGLTTHGAFIDIVKKYNGHVITGMQLEYYPDYDQMQYLEPQLGNYVGFVMQESDGYIDVLDPEHHPWAFYYWSPKILASFVNAWDTSLNMQENKAAIYGVSPRPKMSYPTDFYPHNTQFVRKKFTNNWGTRDCRLLGTKEELLNKLVKNL